MKVINDGTLWILVTSLVVAKTSTSAMLSHTGLQLLVALVAIGAADGSPLETMRFYKIVPLVYTRVFKEKEMSERANISSDELYCYYSEGNLSDKKEYHCFIGNVKIIFDISCEVQKTAAAPIRVHI